SRLALSLAVRPPAEAELRSALTLLADTRKEDERLENYLRGLYWTTCADCKTEVSADAFEWDADAHADEPVEKTYLCPQCGGPPKHSPTDAADRALAKRFTRGRLDYHLLLNRVAPLDDPDRAHAEEALAVYPPRAIAAIAAILVKLDSLDPPAEARRLLCGLLVAAFDAACALGQDRPKVLTVPRRFRENNFWLALEKALGSLAGVAAPNRSMPLPDLLKPTNAPAIHAQAGPARDLAPLLPEGSCALIISGIPRPNQAYWTLSALWSAWLWGRESASVLRSVLRRRRYDWTWHFNALRGTFASVLGSLASEGKMIGLMAEAEPGFTGCLLAAADGAGYALADAVLRADTAEAQFIWDKAPSAAPPATRSGPLLEAEIKNTALQSARETLLARAEPGRWISVHFGAWSGLAQKRLLAAVPEDPLSAVNHLIEPVFRDPRNFQRLHAEQADDLATGLWRLSAKVRPDTLRVLPRQQPLADRVEAEVLRRLSSGAPVEENELIQAVCSAFPGAHTPGKDLVLACLSSYAHRISPETWQLRPEDASAARAKELESIQAELRALAVRLAYDVAGANPQEWREEGQTIYLFAVITSAVFSGYVLGRRFEDPLSEMRERPIRRRFLVLPGGRSGLAAFKLRRDPRLHAALREGNWQIIKFRHVRRMAGDVQLTRATLEPAFYGDPLDEARQLSLIVD
ncbi:MAG: hypothetical protein HY784_18130, partial [Chloroflexi bacterium]|nr:hypothetical protein [Chloroflexota bacterium]